MLLALLLSCTEDLRDSRQGPGGGWSGDTAPPDTAGADTAGADSGEVPGDGGAGPEGPCAPGMVEIADLELGTFCIDAFEARIAGHSPYEVPLDGVAEVVEGEIPQAYISGEVAALACAAAGKRLCREDEWLRACRGPEGFVYPYGDLYEEDACNTEYDGTHPVVDYFGTSEGVWDLEHMNDPGINQQPGTVAVTGGFQACASWEGVMDLHGNLHEWVQDEEGTFLGGFYADAAINGEGCGYRTSAHPTSWHDYSTGFRCCAEAEG